MRDALCKALVARASDPAMIFLTGDLGFMALEPLRDVLGPRFINAGVAEQNMVSVASALARDGWQPWCYSIASFCFARPFEQIRNDACLHDLPVKLVGNGGGYGYGVMGPTHHAVDDYGVLLALPHMRVFAPCFGDDVAAAIEAAAASPHPCYLRLGRGELPAGEACPAYRPWRRVLAGRGPVAVAAGPIGGSAWGALRELPEDKRPDLWLVTELPLPERSLPPELAARLAAGAGLVTIEEHVAQGGLGDLMARRLLTDGVPVRRFAALTAAGLATGGVYGSQAYLRRHSGLGPEAIRDTVLGMGKGLHE